MHPAPCAPQSLERQQESAKIQGSAPKPQPGASRELTAFAGRARTSSCQPSPASSGVTSGPSHGHIPVCPTPLAPCPAPEGWLTTPLLLQRPLPCTSRAWLGFRDRQETPWKCLLGGRAVLPRPSCLKGLQDPVHIPKSWVHVKQDLSTHLNAGGRGTRKLVSPKIFLVWILDLPPR